MDSERLRRETARAVMLRVTRALGASVLLLLLMGAAVAVAADIGHKDFTDPSGSAVTGSKPESKAWYNDGTWWASMQSSSSTGFWIYRLDPNTETWVKTTTPLDDRNKTRADTLWDGTHLYVASQVWNDQGGGTATGTNGQTRLYRFSYNSGTKTYSLDNGFPASMRTNIQSETLVIAKDSTGMLWATWTQGTSNTLVYTNHTVGNNDASWSAPAVLPVGGQGVGVTTNVDDISTIIAFTVGGEHRIGVLWSNQDDVRDYFAWHVDGTSDATWTAETAIAPSGGNPKPADDHLNIKTTSDGTIYAVAKTSNSSSSQPMEDMLVRQPNGGWSSFTVARAGSAPSGDSPTRAILEIDETAGKLHVFETGPHNGSGSGQSGGDIYEKVSNISPVSFPVGLGTPVMRANLGTGLNDATSTKQNFNATTGLVVLAFDDDSDTYWHHDTGFGPPPDPVAGFTAAPTSGTAPVTVNFTNTSTGTPTLTYAWDFGDPGSGVNNTSTATNPSHTYSNAGTYTVKLTTTNGNNVSDTNTQANLVTVAGPTSTLTLTPDADAQVKSDSPTNNYGSLASVRTRTDPGTGSTYRTYLRFNVQGLTGTPITSVKLRLFTSDATTDIQSVFPIVTNPNWIETGTGSINWNNAPSIGSTLLGSGSMPTLGAYNEITLDPSAISANGLVTFALKSSGTNSMIANSKEAPNPTNPPQLVIVQAVGPSNTPPTADAQSPSVVEDTATPITLSGSDPDATNCELTFTIVTPPSHGALGSITGNACVSGSPNTDSASVTYTPAGNYNGTDSFTYKVNDGTADSTPATVSITVTAVNDAPVAVATSASTTVNTATSVTLRGSDVDTCELASFTVTAPPAHGTLTGPTDNACVAGSPNTDTQTITYTPDNNYTGPDSFTYKVNDGSLDSLADATATLAVTASNTAPTADAKSPSVVEDTATAIALSGSDPETCELIFSIVTPPTHGGLGTITGDACAGSGPFTDSASVTYTPAGNYNGTDSFTYKVNDGTADSTPATVSITVTAVNDKPTADAVSVSTAQNTPKAVTLTGHDVEDCNLTFAVTGGPSHGSVGSITTNACTPGTPNTDTASITYTPTSGYTGGDSFTYKVTDGGPLDSTDATVTITVTGGSPTTITLNPVADSHVNSGSATANYGTLNPIRTREDATLATPTYRPYYQFNVPAFSGTVQSVKLRLFVTTASSAMTQSVYLVGNGWTETGINWGNAPALPGSSIGSGIAGTANAYVEFTLTTPINPSTTYSFALKSSGTTSVYFSTREDATNKPQLVIVYQ